MTDDDFIPHDDDGVEERHEPEFPDEPEDVEEDPLADLVNAADVNDDEAGRPPLTQRLSEAVSSILGEPAEAQTEDEEPDRQPPSERAGAAIDSAIESLPDWNWPLVAGGLLAALIAVTAFAAAWYFAGPVSAFVYTLAFVVGAGGVPGIIYGLGPSMPAFLGKPLGRGMFILQQLTFGEGYLIERDKEYEMCPGRDGEEVYVDGEWRAVNATDNMTVAGWQPFGTVRYKDDRTLSDVRVDDVSTDGGQSAADIAHMSMNDILDSDDDHEARDRGGYTETSPPSQNSGWAIDLVQYYSRGLRKVADIASIEKSEEVAMREEAKEGRTAGNEVVVGSLVGLILGAATAYLVM